MNGSTAQSTQPVQKEQVEGSPMRKKVKKPVPSMEQDPAGKQQGPPMKSPMSWRGR